MHTHTHTHGYTHTLYQPTVTFNIAIVNSAVEVCSILVDHSGRRIKTGG